MKRLVVAAALAVLAIAVLAGCRTQAQDQVAIALNADRTARNIAPLAPSAMLDTKAQAWAEQLAREGERGLELRHNLPLTNGVTGCWRSLGENVGKGPNVPAIELEYMSSPLHRDNILGITYPYNLVGVGYAKDSKGTVYTVQEFEQSC